MNFLKLGGSLITEKHQPRTSRPETLARLAREIHAARPGLLAGNLLLGHGSGSYGHTSARKFGTRSGVYTPEGWLGFAQVWRDARALNQIVVEALAKADLPVVAFSPSAFVQTMAGQICGAAVETIQSALLAGLLPLVNGDVVFDSARGGTILSTEELFIYLAPLLKPDRILLAGLERGVWEDFPVRSRLIHEITPANYTSVRESLGGSAATDVTGGMLQKVETMLALVQGSPGLEVLIFSGEEPGNLAAALQGNNPGTRIWSDKGGNA